MLQDLPCSDFNSGGGGRDRTLVAEMMTQKIITDLHLVLQLLVFCVDVGVLAFSDDFVVGRGTTEIVSG